MAKRTKKSKSQKVSTSKKSGSKANPAPTRLRTVKKPKYKSFRMSRRIKPDAHKKLPGAWQLLRRSLAFTKNNWRLLGGIASVYFLLILLLGRGLSGINLDDVIFDIQTSSDVEVTGVSLGASLFAYLLTSAGGATTERGSTYVTLLTIIVSLVTIWALRQTMAGKKPAVKQAYYSGTVALIPFILVLLVVGLQLLPMVIGGWLYGTVVGGGIAILFIEKVAWGLLFFTLTVLSLYMITSSVFALYIVNLPGLTPMQALRSARELVLHRRFELLRKLLFLPLAFTVIGAIILIPILIVAPTLAAWLYMYFSAVALIVVHVYMYSLYRELL